MGVGFARAEIVLLIVAAHAVGFYWFTQGWDRAFTLPLATLPIGLFVAWRVIVEPPGRGHNRLLAMSGAQLLAFAALMCWAIVKARYVMP
jgi:1,4-dihydroxy-2-naphthoate octaprenyltransferase